MEANLSQQTLKFKRHWISATATSIEIMFVNLLPSTLNNLSHCGLLIIPPAQNSGGLDETYAVAHFEPYSDWEEAALVF